MAPGRLQVPTKCGQGQRSVSIILVNVDRMDLLGIQWARNYANLGEV